MRNLVLVLGDRLDPASAAFDGFDAKHDAVWMAEVPAESEHVWSHKARTPISSATAAGSLDCATALVWLASPVGRAPPNPSATERAPPTADGRRR